MWTTEEITRWERNVDAMVRQAATNDPTTIAELLKLRDRLEDGIARAAVAQNANGFSWEEIGEGAGTGKVPFYRWVQRRLGLRREPVSSAPC